MIIDDYRGHDTSREALAKYRRDGFALFPKLFSDAEIDELKMRAMLHRGDERLRQEQRGARGTIVFWSAAIDPALDAVRTSPRLLDIVAETLGTTDIKQHSQQLCYRDPGAPGSLAWHRDEFGLSARVADPRRTSVALAIYLDDVLDADQGAVLFVAGSHKQDGNEFLESPEDERCEVMLPRRGMVGLWNPGTIHGSRPNITARDRRSLMHGYVRADATTNPEDIWAWRNGVGLSYAQGGTPV